MWYFLMSLQMNPIKVINSYYLILILSQVLLTILLYDIFSSSAQHAKNGSLSLVDWGYILGLSKMFDPWICLNCSGFHAYVTPLNYWDARNSSFIPDVWFNNHWCVLCVATHGYGRVFQWHCRKSEIKWNQRFKDSDVISLYGQGLTW